MKAFLLIPGVRMADVPGARADIPPGMRGESVLKGFGLSWEEIFSKGNYTPR